MPKAIDLHCDVLYQLSTRQQPTNFATDVTLQAGLPQLKQGNIKAQVFAIFVDESIPQRERYMEAIRQIELFQTQVLAQPEMIHITDWAQLDTLEEDQIGAILSLEGCDAIDGSLHKLQTFLDAGVKLVGLTWNYANAVAHGAQEDPTQGLTAFGREVVSYLNERQIIMDVSHLNEQSFWDVLPLAKHIVASHSNARAICDHVRNLTDAQAKALIEAGGHIHLVYNPPFIERDRTDDVSIDSLVMHYRHFVNLVGVDHLGLGSDFDGIEHTVLELQNSGQTPKLLEKLQVVFSEEDVAKIAASNFERFVRAI
ncbi:dipeptidase [Kurthia senegalensis]|uniref:dipeptidase n=1 Tax=Kurthia senegalensis TaxID=1033740 RepID=UPI00028889EC|nr:dipeptidase [Kurthia senegalensis]